MQAELGPWRQVEGQGLTVEVAKQLQGQVHSLEKVQADLTTLLRDKRAQLTQAHARIDALERDNKVRCACALAMVPRIQMEKGPTARAACMMQA